MAIHAKHPRTGFTLIEVVLALGVFLISVLALIGLLAPMLQSVDEIEKVDEITSVVNTINAFIQSSPEIAVRDPDDGSIIKTKFNAIYEAVKDGDEATVFVYRYYDESQDDMIRLEVGFSDSEQDIVGDNSIVKDFFNVAAGPIYRVVLSASSVTPLTPVQLRSDPRDGNTGIYTLLVDLVDYTEGYLAFEARIFAETPPGPNGAFNTQTDLAALSLREPDFTFNCAIVR